MILPHLLMPMDDAAIGPLTVSSPKNKHIKFLCSHGGKILPRPADGQLKYVGGETRLVSVAKDIPFHQLMKKLCLVSCKGEFILKYQVVSEDLDALVSVKSDEDVVHMFDEINHWENARRGSRVRSFLFPTTNPNQMDIDPLQLEQRYVDAINGICRQYPSTVRHGSTGSSPTSPDSCTTETTNNYDSNNSQSTGMHKVQSLPNIGGTNFFSQQQNNHYGHQVRHQRYQSPRRVPLHLHKIEKLASLRSVRKQARGNGHCMKCSLHSDDNANNTNFSDTKFMFERTRSRAMSPVPSNTRLAHALG